MAHMTRARKLSRDDLLDLGLPEEKIQSILRRQMMRVKRFELFCSDEIAERIRVAFPDVVIKEPYYRRDRTKKGPRYDDRTKSEE